GYTWNRNLIPDPVGFLHDMHALNLKTALNLHPADGIRPYDDFYEGFVKDYLSRTNDYDGPEGYVYPKQGYQFVSLDKPVGREGYRAPVPFRISQREWTDAYFNSVIHPLERQGVDFWWLDWQQWITSRYMEGLNTTFWLNYTFFNDMVRQSRSQGLDARRPLIYHRWGGLGSHRYQLGFSGDTYDEWAVLEFLPYFTATASNVGYGYWGHDIGGHMNLERHLTNPEMYTRWIQYGVFTPIFKTHSSSFPTLDRRIWSYPTHYEYMREAIKLRYALSPYIYTAARHAYDTGVSICRPLYYDYPEVENAYTWNQEYMFGDQILATVLCKPIWKGKTERSMWFPEGNDWYDMASHKMMKGGQTVTLYYTIDQNPWFVKAGSIIPLAEENIQSLQQPSNKLRLLVIPGKGKSAYTLYEDDGDTQNYKNDYATTTITKEDNGNTVTMQVAPRNGSYKNMPATRQITVMLEGVKTAPKTVKFNGSKVNADAVALKNGHVEVTLPETACSSALTIEILK
ncbi:MAG: DUF5110 domain-containing protein, partial [Bacteroidales bacterium]|nr:DUF5110 domain-containing protein [Candidatus Sodaliphilus aphodohippi]